LNLFLNLLLLASLADFRPSTYEISDQDYSLLSTPYSLFPLLLDFRSMTTQTTQTTQTIQTTPAAPCRIFPLVLKYCPHVEPITGSNEKWAPPTFLFVKDTYGVR
jgi:hypothetical protein